MILLLLVMAACAPKTPPPVFAQAIPEPEAPRVLDLPEGLTADACLDVVPYLPGKPPPLVVDGLVTCRAQIVPELDVIQAIRDGQLVTYWQALYETSHHHRGIDRLHCDDIAGARWEYTQELRHELRMTKTAAAVAGVVGFIAGGLIVAGIERVTR